MNEPCYFCGGEPLSDAAWHQHMVDVHNAPPLPVAPVPASYESLTTPEDQAAVERGRADAVAGRTIPVPAEADERDEAWFERMRNAPRAILWNELMRVLAERKESAPADVERVAQDFDAILVSDLRLVAEQHTQCGQEWAALRCRQAAEAIQAMRPNADDLQERARQRADTFAAGYAAGVRVIRQRPTRADVEALREVEELWFGDYGEAPSPEQFKKDHDG